MSVDMKKLMIVFRDKDEGDLSVFSFLLPVEGVGMEKR